MNTKHIIALVTFVVAFTASSVLVKLVRPTYQNPAPALAVRGCRVSNAQHISNLLQQDVANGRVRDNEVWSSNYSSAQSFSELPLDYYATSTSGYLDKMEGLSAENTSSDFQAAWQKHVEAWQNQSSFLESVADISGSKYSDIRNSPTYISNDTEITRTWYEVLRVAKQNGAIIPAGAY